MRNDFPIDVYDDDTFQNDSVFVEQFTELPPQLNGYWTPERKLMKAILVDAFHSVYGYLTQTSLVRGRFLKRPIRQQEYEEAVTWFLDTEEEWLYSFRSICRHLELKRHRCVLLIARWHEQHKKAA